MRNKFSQNIDRMARLIRKRAASSTNYYEVPIRIFIATLCYALVATGLTAIAQNTSVNTQNGAKSGETIIEGRGEIFVEGAKEAEADWTPAEIALREAMDQDRTFARSNGSGLTQSGAISAYQSFLKRKDIEIPEELRIFAQWRIGSLYAYNFDRKLGEKRDWEKAAGAFKKVMDNEINIVSNETINAATVYATLGGSPEKRAARMAEAYNWLATRTDEMVVQSSDRINAIGYAVSTHLLAGVSPRQTSLEDRIQYLTRRLPEARKNMEKRIAEMIRYSQDPDSILMLLEAIKDVVDPRTIDQWYQMLLDVYNRKFGVEKLLDEHIQTLNIEDTEVPQSTSVGAAEKVVSLSDNSVRTLDAPSVAARTGSHLNALFLMLAGTVLLAIAIGLLIWKCARPDKSGQDSEGVV